MIEEIVVKNVTVYDESDSEKLHEYFLQLCK